MNLAGLHLRHLSLDSRFPGPHSNRGPPNTKPKRRTWKLLPNLGMNQWHSNALFCKLLNLPRLNCNY